jgi:hypothetical protein
MGGIGIEERDSVKNVLANYASRYGHDAILADV